MLDSIMDALGYAGDSLAKPGRAVRGVLGGRPEEALAAIPFSDTLGLTDSSNQVSGQDLLRHAGIDLGDGIAGGLAGFGVEAATDPLTYLGVGLGRYAGKAAEAAQMARGPRYATTGDDLKRMLQTAPQAAMDRGDFRVNDILKSPNSQRLLSEIHPESSIIGAGAEALAMKTPAGDVLRLGRNLDNHGIGRPISPDILQATRSVQFPGSGIPWSAERSPLAEMLTDNKMFRGQETVLNDRLGSQGLSFGDNHIGNLGMVDGRPVVIDPGAVDVGKNFTGGFQPVTQAAEPGRGTDLLLRLLGGDDAMRQALDAGRAGPRFVNQLTALGGLAGSIPGRFGG